MAYLIKIIIAVSIIVLASELSKRSTTLASILLAMPIVLFASFTIIWEETKNAQKIADITYETVLFILPVIPFLFLLSPSVDSISTTFNFLRSNFDLCKKRAGSPMVKIGILKFSQDLEQAIFIIRSGPIPEGSPGE